MKIAVLRTARVGVFAGLCALLTTANCVAQTSFKITVSAPRQSYRNTPVLVALPPGTKLRPNEPLILEASGRAERLPGQIVVENGQIHLAFLLPELPQGEKRLYQLRRAHLGNASLQTPPPMQVKPEGNDLVIHIGDTLFTRYTTHSGPNKPFFYPILTPDGKPITRRWPMESGTGETTDHPHHRGLWFTHGAVNGIDFWSEEAKTGKTVNTGFSELASGPVCAHFRARTDWIAPDGKQIARDARDVDIYALPNGDRLLDFAITVTPNGVPLIFGDTKEGMYGLRLADTLAPSQKKGGAMINSRGDRNGSAWGKPAEWVDYWGPIAGKTYGVAMFDAPENLRHPQTWHARDYGLFAINPFGLHDFGRGEKGAGDYTVPANGTLHLRYRLLFHQGDTETAAVAAQYAAFADPPEVKVQVQ